MSKKQHPNYRPMLKKVQKAFVTLRQKGIAALANFW